MVRYIETTGDEGVELLNTVRKVNIDGAVRQVSKLDNPAKAANRLRKLDGPTLDYIVRIDSVKRASHLFEGSSAPEIEALTTNIRKINGLDGGEGYLRQFLKSGKEFNLADVRFTERVSTGSQSYQVHLIDTAKWKSSTTFEKGVHDWRHIVVRHIDPDAPGSWPPSVVPGSAAEGKTSMFPTQMGPDEVRNVIKTTLTNAEPKHISNSGRYRKSIAYDGPALPSQIDEMKIVFDKETGRIVTAYPPS